MSANAPISFCETSFERKSLTRVKNPTEHSKTPAYLSPEPHIIQKQQSRRIRKEVVERERRRRKKAKEGKYARKEKIKQLR